MARIRSIKPEFWSSEQVMECSTNARLLFIGLWNFCDDAGRMPLKARQIKAQILPGDDITSENVLGMVEELSANGLITIYTVDNKKYLEITGWHHQRIDKPQKPKYPPNPVNAEAHSANVPRTFPPDRIGEDKSSRREPAARDREKCLPEIIFGACLDYLTEHGATDKHARSELGKWRKLVGDQQVIQLVQRAQKESVTEPIAWIEAAMKPDARKVLPL